MTTLMIALVVLGLAAVPLIALLVDLVPVAITTARHRPTGETTAAPIDDFTVVVPIYGDVRYLENIDYLRDYGARVMLCTTAGESLEFYRKLHQIAEANGFDVFAATYQPPRTSGRRQTGGVTRDRVVREALDHVSTEYVVCLDADTRTEQPLQEMVGTLAARGLDLASVRLVVSNRETSFLARLQAHEYRMSMRMRRIMPWLCSGACHLGRTVALRKIMNRHSLFFQGNDAELGLLGWELGCTIGHMDCGVPTSVPESFRGWLRQRLAWTGGEFRLYVVNARLIRHHPWFIVYGALLIFAHAPLRIVSAVHPGWILLGVVATYWVAVMAANRRHFDLALVTYPVYGLFNSLVMTPLGLISYANMALRSRNAGIIRMGSPPPEIHNRPPELVGAAPGLLAHGAPGVVVMHSHPNVGGVAARSPVHSVQDVPQTSPTLVVEGLLLRNRVPAVVDGLGRKTAWGVGRASSAQSLCPDTSDPVRS